MLILRGSKLDTRQRPFASPDQDTVQINGWLEHNARDPVFFPNTVLPIYFHIYDLNAQH